MLAALVPVMVLVGAAAARVKSLISILALLMPVIWIVPWMAEQR